MVTSEDFVVAYRDSSSVKEVSEKTGLSSQGVSSRAANYRKKGVRLPVMGHPRSPIDVDALNALLEKDAVAPAEANGKRPAKKRSKKKAKVAPAPAEATS